MALARPVEDLHTSTAGRLYTQLDLRKQRDVLSPSNGGTCGLVCFNFRILQMVQAKWNVLISVLCPTFNGLHDCATHGGSFRS